MIELLRIIWNKYDLYISLIVFFSSIALFYTIDYPIQRSYLVNVIIGGYSLISSFLYIIGKIGSKIVDHRKLKVADSDS